MWGNGSVWREFDESHRALGKEGQVFRVRAVALHRPQMRNCSADLGGDGLQGVAGVLGHLVERVRRNVEATEDAAFMTDREDGERA